MNPGRFSTPSASQRPVVLAVTVRFPQQHLAQCIPHGWTRGKSCLQEAYSLVAEAWQDAKLVGKNAEKALEGMLRHRPSRLWF